MYQTSYAGNDERYTVISVLFFLNSKGTDC
jgi:hypothetical protein